MKNSNSNPPKCALTKTHAHSILSTEQIRIGWKAEALELTPKETDVRRATKLHINEHAQRIAHGNETLT